jgi:hypothetical protein
MDRFILFTLAIILIALSSSDQKKNTIAAEELDLHAMIQPFGGPVVHLTAIAETPDGPFVKQNKPIFTAQDVDFPTEDPFVWFQEGNYLAIVRDVVGKFTGDEGAWALMESKNGTDWQPAKQPKVIGSTFYWEGGIPSSSKLERPCLYLENDVPAYLYGATRADKAQTLTFNVAVPLKITN